jgi:hypothetical protein
MYVPTGAGNFFPSRDMMDDGETFADGGESAKLDVLVLKTLDGGCLTLEVLQ